MPDKYAERQDEWKCRGQGMLSFVSDLYSSDTVYTHMITNFLTCKTGHPESSEKQQAVELVVEELVSDISKQVSLVEVKIFGLKR